MAATESFDAVEGLLLLGRLLLASGDAVSDINVRLRAAARAWGVPRAQFIVLPDLVLASVDPDRPAHILSQDLSSPTLRINQVIDVVTLSNRIRRGEVGAATAIVELRRIEATPRVQSLLGQTIGGMLLTLGVAMIMQADASYLPVYLSLGAAVGFVQALAGRVAGLTAIMPVAIAFLASTVVFLATGSEFDSTSIATLVPTITILLPGALLTMAAVDLASGEVVSGSSRFLEGMLQLALLAFGIFAAANLVGIQPSTDSVGAGMPGWAPWAGVAVFAVGVALREDAPVRSLPWLVLVLYVAHSAQVAGSEVVGPILSGFVGMLVVVPLVDFLERFRAAPPAFASFKPAFLLLVPGALGLLGLSQLVAIDPNNGIGGLISALSAILAVALGILVGVRLIRIAAGARAARSQISEIIRLPRG